MSKSNNEIKAFNLEQHENWGKPPSRGSFHFSRIFNSFYFKSRNLKNNLIKVTWYSANLVVVETLAECRTQNSVETEKMRSLEIFVFFRCLHECCMFLKMHKIKLTVRCWKSHALSIFVATFGNMPRFFWFFLPFESSSSSPVPSPDPTLALLASPIMLQ